MAISSYQIQLMSKASGGTTYTKLVDIKEFPDLGGAPESLETTTLSDSMRTSINGIQSLDALEFTANYTKSDYEKLKAIENKDTEFAVYFGETGENGIFKFTGQLSVYANGAGVNEVVEMTITIAPSTVITFE